MNWKIYFGKDIFSSATINSNPAVFRRAEIKYDLVFLWFLQSDL